MRGERFGVVLSRPVGAMRSLARQVRALGGEPICLPSTSLRPAADARAARAALVRAQGADVVVFVSPSAVRFSFQLQPRWRPARATRCVAVGPGTRAALLRRGIEAQCPEGRYDSEGLLAMPGLAQCRGKRIAIVGAAGGRELLAGTLARRGAGLLPVHVYERRGARWDRRHHAALTSAPGCLYWLVSSVEAVMAVRSAADAQGWRRLLRARAIAPGARVAEALHAQGVAQVELAGSAESARMLAALRALRARTGARALQYVGAAPARRTRTKP